MSAPDWSRAPKWATWAAMDSSGAWYFYESQPACAEDLGIFSAGSMRVETAKFPGWQSSAHARPKAARGGLRLVGEMAAYELDDLLAAGWTIEMLIALNHAERVE